MKCTLNPNIESISGKVGGVLYRTYNRPNGKTETRAYLLPRRENGKYGYERRTPPSEKEQAARSRFQQVSAQLNAMSDEDKQRYAQEMRDAKMKFNGKKYNSLRGYIMARLYAQQ